MERAGPDFGEDQNVGGEGPHGSAFPPDVQQLVPVEQVDTRQFHCIPAFELEPEVQPLRSHVQTLPQQIVGGLLKSAPVASCLLLEALEKTDFNGECYPLHTSECANYWHRGDEESVTTFHGPLPDYR